MVLSPINHIALTVRDLEVSGPWYRALIGDAPLHDGHTDGGFHHVVWRLSSGTLISLHQHDRSTDGQRFSEFRVGLDHVGFGCANRAELEAWAKWLAELGIEHGGIIDESYGSGLSFRDPDGIALELFALPDDRSR